MPAGPRPHPGTVDIGDADSVTGFVQDVGDRFGRLDVLVNNAGAEPSMTLQGATVDAWDLTMTVNVRGAMLMCQAALPFWQEQGAGSIVNISSRTYLGSARNPAYASSKAAVVGLTKELAVELGPLGVRSNAVAPSFVLTPFNSQREDLADLDAMVARYAGRSSSTSLMPQPLSDTDTRDEHSRRPAARAEPGDDGTGKCRQPRLLRRAAGPRIRHAGTCAPSSAGTPSSAASARARGGTRRTSRWCCPPIRSRSFDGGDDEGRRRATGSDVRGFVRSSVDDPWQPLAWINEPPT